ncbi:MAG TPA: TIM barrel protein [Chitinophagaceae bacterium]
MKNLSRRKFVTQGAMAFAGVAVLSNLPKRLWALDARFKDMPIGFQSWSVKEQLGKDLNGTLKGMADQGYQLIELCSPKGYATIGFGEMAAMKTADIRKAITDAGLSCPSCHFGFEEMTGPDLDDRIAFAKEIGMTQMICSTFWLPKTSTLNDYLEHADKLNKAAEKIKAAGMQAGFHNHDFEFNMLEGQLIYDALMNRFDKDLVKMQFQTEVINLGYKAATYFQKYPGRFISSHLSDWTADKKEVPVGQGVIDWKEFFAAAQTGGVKNFFVEMSPDKFRESAAFIKKI